MEPEIFSVILNEEGRQSLRRFAKLALAILVVTVVVCIVQTLSLWSAFKTLELKAGDSRMMKVLLLAVLGILFSFVLPVIQVLYYRRFAIRIARASSVGDSPAFNRSFHLLHVQSVLFLVQVVGSLAVVIIRLFVLKI